MKFKNYVNSLTGDNRIYSLNDITQMALGDVLKNKEELLSQYRVLGVPTESELQNSDNVVYVKAYTREDGTEVKAHYRSKPDGIASNNFSHGTPTGGASEVKELLKSNLNDSKILEGYVSTTKTVEDIKGFARENIKPYRDYEHLEPIERVQKWVSKHTPWWTPSEYYGISEYLADDGRMPEKYAKHNDHYKLGDIADERTRKIISDKVKRARRDCPVGPYINSPLEDVDVIVPKDDSDLVQEVMRSAEVRKFVENHRAELESGKTVNGSIEFKRPNNILVNYLQHPIKTNDKVGRFTAIHYADIVDAKMNDDGSITIKLVDYYDFTKLEGNDEFDKLNNRAYKQQVLGKLKPYVIYKELRYKI